MMPKYKVTDDDGRGEVSRILCGEDVIAIGSPEVALQEIVELANAQLEGRTLEHAEHCVADEADMTVIVDALRDGRENPSGRGHLPVERGRDPGGRDAR